MIYKGWELTETQCFPCSWKRQRIGFKRNNDTHNYHETLADAKREIDKIERIENEKETKQD